jgi:chromosome partitioning protein
VIILNKIIAVANQKGGVGKTTTSINLAACLAKSGKKTLIIDIDPQGNTTSGIGINKREVNYSVYDLLINGIDIKETILKTRYDNLNICPSNINLAGAEIELVDINKREYILKNVVKEVSNDYEYIIIDCPPSLGLLTLNAFTCAKSVLIPIQCEYYALEGLSQLTKTIKKVKQNLNPELEIEGVLLTMYDARTNLSIQVVEEVKKYFPTKVYKTIIPRNVRLSEAPSFGEPIIIYDPKSKGAECYFELAKEIILSA